MDNRPSNTIYANNLNDRVKKPDLRRALYYLFSQFGKIIDIIAMKTPKMRGQAFIIFKDISSSTSAMRTLQGYNFFDKPMRLHYARKESTQISRIKGQKLETQRKRDEEKEKRRKKKAAQRALLAASTVNDEATTSDAVTNGVNNDKDEEKGDASVPNNVLFLSNLPSETTEAMLQMLFAQFTGFKEVRQISGRADIAFIEYDTETQAGTAKVAYEGFKLTPTRPIKIEYAKK